MTGQGARGVLTFLAAWLCAIFQGADVAIHLRDVLARIANFPVDRPCLFCAFLSALVPSWWVLRLFFLADSMSDILEKILAVKRDEIAAAKRARS